MAVTSILDPGEDVNANGTLEPAVPAINAHPDETPTIDQHGEAVTAHG